jgi:hypothetical protein
MYAALEEGRVDDFLSRLGRVERDATLDQPRIESAYATLACRGNVAGIEAIAHRTHVVARLDEPTARRAFDVLATMGRVGAIDYVRQLSGLAPTFSADAVQRGYRLLLLSGRFQTMCDLRQLCGVDPVLSPNDIQPAVERAVADLELAGLAALASIVRWREHAFVGCAALLERVVQERRFRQVAPLFQLAADADARLLTEPILTAILQTRDPASIAFIYTQPDLREFQLRHRDEAYRIGVASRSRALVRAACISTGVAVRREDLAPLVEDALAAVDPEWIEFAHAREGALPATDPTIAQTFLFELRRVADPRAERMERVLSVAYDPALGAWGYAIKHGELARARGMRVDGAAPLAAAIQRVLAEVDPTGP